MLFYRARAPVQAAKAARIVETQALARIEHEVVVVVQQSRRTRRHHAQAAGHAEVGDERTAVEIDQEVLGTATHVVNVLADKFAHEPRLDRPAQARLAQVESRDGMADHGFAHAATCRFDFG